MLFNSIEFLIFFPLVTTLYFLVTPRWRWLLLLIASCVFYMAWIPVYVLILFLIIGIDYVAAQKIEVSQGTARKTWLGLSIFANVSILALFKYYNFLCENLNGVFHTLNFSYQIPALNLILPIGLSFHTFQALAYTIEVYKGKQVAEKHLGIYALYVMFYPQLVAGPIERPQHLIHQFKEEHKFDDKRMASGLRLMLWGLFKKVVIADRLAILVNQVYGSPQEYSGLPLLIATYCFAYQIYCDFSGYTDIAIGAARVLGIDLVTNFRSPYSATSVQEFWHRWHISLSTWFRDYLYVPLGGSRIGQLGKIRNILIVFFVSGLWHGASWTFAQWGLLHGLYMIIYLGWRQLPDQSRALLKVPVLGRFIGIFLTFNAVCFAWIFFRATTTQDALWIATHLLPLNNADLIPKLGLTGGEMLVALVSILILEIVQFVDRNYGGQAVLDKMRLSVRWAGYYVLILIISLLGEFGGQRFLYFQF
ncbi:MAG: MBOAT family protein [Leptolyngbya sp.]|nr:MBOAT family protein [Candidatus Melainabacteria bacterium]